MLGGTSPLLRLLRASLAIGPIFVLACLAGCASPLEGPEPVMRLRWSLTDPSAPLPASVEQLRLRVYRADAPVEVDCNTGCEETFFTVAGLPTAESGRPFLQRNDLPTDEPIRLLLAAFEAGGTLTHVGQVGPIVLGVGERRYVDIQMYQVGQSAMLPMAGLPGRFGHTATSLPDGRVLIAGGFTSIQPATCPSTEPAGAICYDAVAADEAWAFDVSTGLAVRIREPMLAARGGHSATMLTDGRVLIAGGAEQATFVWIPQSGPGGTVGYDFRVLTTTAHASFEVFDVYANDMSDDSDRDGDPARGAFLGQASQPAQVGPLNAARFMHAAAAVGDRVLLVGGVASPETYEVFDARRPGGYGVYPPAGNRLAYPRQFPSALAIGESVWIVGGRDAASNAELAEVWTVDDPAMPNGASTDATMGRSFPSVAGDPRPELSLFAPAMAPVAGGASTIAVGWYGPVCDPAMPSAPVFAGSVAGAIRCDSSPTRTRSVTIDGASGIAAPTQVRNSHAFGRVAVLADGTVIVSGGAANPNWTGQSVMSVFSGSVDIMGAALPGADPPSTRAPRLFHAIAPLADQGVLLVGGIQVDLTASSASLVMSPEAIFLRR